MAIYLLCHFMSYLAEILATWKCCRPNLLSAKDKNNGNLFITPLMSYSEEISATSKHCRTHLLRAGGKDDVNLFIKPPYELFGRNFGHLETLSSLPSPC
jgi:hypothetical protein